MNEKANSWYRGVFYFLTLLKRYTFYLLARGEKRYGECLGWLFLLSGLELGVDFSKRNSWRVGRFAYVAE